MRRGVRASWQAAQRAQRAPCHSLRRRPAARCGPRLALASGHVPAAGPLGCRAARRNPCYEPSTTLVFHERQQHGTTLIFVCERHRPPPRTGETVVVPTLEVYTVQNSISLVRLDSGEPLEALAFR